MNAGCDIPGVTLRRLTAEDSATLRDVRLRALRDAPTAFCSSHAEESALDEAGWKQKASQWTDPARAVTFVALIDEAPVGLIAGFLDREAAGRAWLVSMWVDRARRRLGIGRALIERVIGWAKTAHADQLLLHVTHTNDTARQLYERMGFVPTGGSMPHPRRPDLREDEMRLFLG